MNPNQNPSLIPKGTGIRPAYKARGSNFLIIGTIIIFFISAGLLGGAYFYKRFLNTDIGKFKSDLQEVEAGFEPAAIHELVRASKVIDGSKAILSGHKAVSNVFDVLGDLTLANVRFSNFSFESNKGENKDYIISMKGEASGYTAVAEQAAVFEKSDFIKKATFSGFALKGGNGNVSFSVVITINPEFIKYE